MVIRARGGLGLVFFFRREDLGYVQDTSNHHPVFVFLMYKFDIGLRRNSSFAKPDIDLDFLSRHLVDCADKKDVSSVYYNEMSKNMSF